jgi:hypothetical protein
MDPLDQASSSGIPFGAVLEGFPPGSKAAKAIGGVYRVCGEYKGLPRFRGAEAHNSDAHMYRRRGTLKYGMDEWNVNNEFTPHEPNAVAYVANLPGGAVPVYGREGVRWGVWSYWLGLPMKDGEHYSVEDQPLVLTTLVRTSRCLPASLAIF